MVLRPSFVRARHDVLAVGKECDSDDKVLVSSKGLSYRLLDLLVPKSNGVVVRARGAADTVRLFKILLQTKKVSLTAVLAKKQRLGLNYT